MKKMHTTKVSAHYDEESKTLYLDTYKHELIPSYLYYVCEYLESKEHIKIEQVVFNQDDVRYNVADLHKARDWSEVKCEKEN